MTPCASMQLCCTLCNQLVKHCDNYGTCVGAKERKAYSRFDALPEAKCKCGEQPIPHGADGIHWYWQYHSRTACTLELPNSQCWCGLLRSEHLNGHDEKVADVQSV